ncbi:ubiquitin carboxyl-terminal hydrolase 50-like isoform X2 [Nelusetta ayraudi]|uniref:ubiquitin carboxyl-terminal hydrolase 50-like isoform X2 n=1 Tax=Nelusetta ayraudi TaxID=303726 RepID=UPI003F72A166
MDILEKFRRKLDDLTVSDYYGLSSPGLTCYLNSVLQVLFMTKDFCEAVERCCKKEASLLDQHLCQLFADLRESEAKTHNIIESLGITNVYEQRDAAEYFEKILRLTSLDAAKMFRGELNYTTKCVSCRKKTDFRCFFWSLPLEVEDSSGHGSSVENGLKAFFEGQKVCGDNQMFCNRCDEKQDAVCQCEMTQTPKILTLLLKRFSFDSKCRSYIKLHSKVNVPQTLHVKGCHYDLYATVNHYGTLKGGHYDAKIKSYENQVWYQFSDNTVLKMRSQLFKGGVTSLSCSTSYLLMYRKVNKHTGRVGFWKSPCEDARASRNLGGPRKAVVAEVKCESLNREENCRVWEGAGKLTGSVNQEAACPRQHKSTADGRKAHTPPPREWRVPGRCELHRSSAVPPIGQSYRSGRPTAAEQSRTQQKDKRRSTRAGTEKRRSSHPYESSHWVKKQ